MFGTLRYNAQSNEPEFVERASGPLMSELNGYVPAHTACDKCRSKKVGLQAMFFAKYLWTLGTNIANPPLFLRR